MQVISKHLFNNTAMTIKDSCLNFALTAAPYLNIKDDRHYKEALALIESLLEDADDSLDAPINAVIDMLSHAIEVYENKDMELLEFETRAMENRKAIDNGQLKIDNEEKNQNQ